MDARNYLRQIHRLEALISMRQRQIKDLRKSMAYMKSMDYSADRVQTSPDGSGFTSDVIRLVDMELEIERKIYQCEHLRETIIGQIERMPDQRYIDVLSGIYIHRKDLMDLADDLHYDYYWVCHLHGEALSAFERQYPEIRNQTQENTN